jgi:hypothetical protein
MRNPALYYFAGAILVSLATTVLLCRRRMARKKRSFFLTALAGNLIANAVLFVVVFVSGRIYADGWRVFTRQAWASGSLHSLESSLSDAGLLIGLGTFICMLPVLGVAFYFERRSKKDPTQVA